MNEQTVPDAGTWWTVPEAAEHLQVSENAVYAAIRAGQIPVLHVGTQPRISPRALDEWTLERARRGLASLAEVSDAASTPAPTGVGTDRLRPKHIKTAAWRRTDSANRAGS